MIRFVAHINSYSDTVRAIFSIKPTPVVPASISAATNVPQQTPIEILMPVKISGKAFGKITYLKILLSAAPKECEALIFDSCVPDAQFEQILP